MHYCFEKNVQQIFKILFTPQPLREMVSGLAGGQVGGWREKVCPGCI